jgi:predicted esterase
MRLGRPATLVLAISAILHAGAGCATTAGGASAAPAGPGGGGGGGGAMMMTANVTPLAVDLRGVPLNPGLRWVNVTSTAPVQRRMVVMVPDGPEAAGQRPLVFFLHGAGGGAKLPERLSCLVAPGLAHLAPIVIAPEFEGGEWWNEAETAYVLGLMDAAVRDWRARVDIKRLVMMGYSNGGIGAWFFARLYPEGLSAAIPMSANHAIIGESPLPIRVIHGSNDRLFDVAKVRAGVQALAQRGFNVTLAVREGGQHEDACGYKPELEAAAAWLENTVWKTPPAPAPAPGK